MHGINLNEGSEEIVVERVRVFQTAGDGLRFLGRAKNPDLRTPDNRVRKVRVEGCQFVQNKRTGIAFQRATEFVWVRNCYIEMTPPGDIFQRLDVPSPGEEDPSNLYVKTSGNDTNTGWTAK